MRKKVKTNAKMRKQMSFLQNKCEKKKLFLQNKGSAPTPPCLRRLGALPHTPSLRRLRPQTPKQPPIANFMATRLHVKALI